MKHRKYVYIIAAILVICWSAFHYALPEILHTVIIDKATAAGLESPEFDIVECDLNHTALANFRAGDATPISIDVVEASHDLNSLGKQRLKRIRIDGLKIPATVENGKIDFGQLSSLKGTGGGYPFDELLVKNMSLQIRSNESHAALHFPALTVIPDNDRLHISTSKSKNIQLSAVWNGTENSGSLNLTTTNLDFTTAERLLKIFRIELPLVVNNSPAIELSANISANPLRGKIALLLERQKTPFAVTYTSNGKKVSGAFDRLNAVCTIKDHEKSISLKIEIDEPAVNGHRLPAITLNSEMRGDTASFGITPTDAGEISPSIAGHIKYAPKEISGKAVVNIPEFDLTLAEKFFTNMKELQDYSLTGKASANATISVTQNQLAATGILNLKQAGIKSQEMDMATSGINGTINISYPSTTSTQEASTLTIEELRSGELRLSGGALTFRTTPDWPAWRLAFDKVSFNYANGTISSAPFSFEHDSKKINLPLKFKNIGLPNLLELAAAGRAAGEGSLSGYWRIAIVLQPQLALKFGEGLLRATPETGWFGIKEKEDAALILKGARLTGDEFHNKQVDRMESAMQDFAFDGLEIRFTPENSDRIMAYVKTKGKGPRHDPLVFGGLSFNIAGLEDLLNYLIIRSSDMKAEIDANVGNAIRNAFELKTGEEEDNSSKNPEAEKAAEMFF